MSWVLLELIAPSIGFPNEHMNERTDGQTDERRNTLSLFYLEYICPIINNSQIYKTIYVYVLYIHTYVYIYFNAWLIKHTLVLEDACPDTPTELNEISFWISVFCFHFVFFYFCHPWPPRGGGQETHSTGPT